MCTAGGRAQALTSLRSSDVALRDSVALSGRLMPLLPPPLLMERLLKFAQLPFAPDAFVVFGLADDLFPG